MKNKIIKVLIFTLISFIYFDYNSYNINANEKLPTSINIQNEEVNIPDKNFKKTILEKLGKKLTDSITKSDMESLTILSIPGVFTSYKISNLEGIQYAKNLKYLNISSHKISDIELLTNLTNLKLLDISYNNISDIGPLRNLIKLESLNLDSNHILDFSPLKNLPNKDKFRKGTILEQNVYYDEVRLTGDSFKVKNPFIGIDGEMITKLHGQDFGNYIARSEGDYLIWDNITEKDIIKSNFELNAIYSQDWYDDYGRLISYRRCARLHIPIAPFNDIYNHWAEYTIRECERKKIIAKDIRFRPNESMTRAEFVKIFNKTFKLSKHSGKTFKDTKNHWAYYEIDIAVTNGVCNGKTKTEFKPDDPITRQEAATMLSNYLNLSDNNIDKIVKYKDSNDISSWAKHSVEGVIEKGYMGGYSDNTFKPKNNMTRAEALSMLSRIK